MIGPGPSLWELVVARASSTPLGVCAVDEDDRVLTFAELRDRAERWAGVLSSEHGVGAGSVVAWQMPTWIETLALCAALSRLGAVQVPIIPILRHRELTFILGRTGATLFVVPSRFRGVEHLTMAEEVVAAMGASSGAAGAAAAAAVGVGQEPAGGASAGGTCRVLVLDRGDELRADAAPGGDAPSSGAPVTTPPSPPDAAEVRWIFATSGTEADPKLVLHSDATIIAAAAGVARAHEMTPDDRFAFVFPVTHVGGVQTLAESLLAGFGSILVSAFVPATSIPVLAHHGVTVAGAGTAFWLAYLAAHRARPPGAPELFPAMRAMVGGGAPKPPELVHEMWRELGVPVAGGYGLTECPSCILGAVGDPIDRLADTDGRPVAGVEARIAGDTGELLVRGPSRCLGYLDPATTDAAFDADGFLHTGDLATIDVDGWVTITGRLKDVIIRKGENISAKEVEDVLYRHAAVADVAIVGLPDAERGERACAVVVLAAPGAPALTLADVVAHCRAQGLGMHKLPEQLEIVTELPRNPSGKVLKYVLRERFGG